MRNSTKMGGSIKKKYQAGGSTGYMKPTKKVMTKKGPDSYDKAIAKNKAVMESIKKGAIKNPKMKMNPAKIRVGSTKTMDPVDRLKAFEKMKSGSMPKKQMGGMANARKKSLINRYNKASDRAKNAQGRALNAEDYFQNSDTNYDSDNQIQGANPVTYTAGRKRQNAKINNAQARVGKNAERETQIYKNVETAERAYKNNKSDKNDANWHAALDVMTRDYSGDDTNRTLSKIRGVENRVERKVNKAWDKNDKRVEKIGKKLDKMGPKKTTAEMKRGGSVKKYQSGGMIPAKPIATAPMQGTMGRRGAAGSNMAQGGSLKPVNRSANPGLAKLPTPVRNKMGYAKKGGAQKIVKKLLKKNVGGPSDGILPPPTIGGGSGSMGSSAKKPLNANVNIGRFSAGMTADASGKKPLGSANYKANYTSKSGLGANVGYDPAKKKVNAGVSYQGALGKKKQVPIKVSVDYNKSKKGGAVKRKK